jgi:hypothetical protein
MVWFRQRTRFPVRGAALHDADLDNQVDGASYSFLGKPVVQGANFKLAVQKSATVSLTVGSQDACMLTCPPRSLHRPKASSFSAQEGLTSQRPFCPPLRCTFSLPLANCTDRYYGQPEDLVKQSTPLSYLAVSANSNDNQQHKVQIYTDISAEWVNRFFHMGTGIG